ncbi:hypothetical protein [Microbispora sp. CA-102843]|uniref:hypothetical protein n=1 Tax=Microbispora sp. CA-102843 TaxID=3239952 RepID=UPI003D92FDAE
MPAQVATSVASTPALSQVDRAACLRDAVVDVARLDACAARDVLNHHLICSRLAKEQRQKLDDVLTASGLGAGKLSPVHMQALITAVDMAEVTLRGLL